MIVLLVAVGCGGGLVVGWWPCIKLSFFFLKNYFNVLLLLYILF